MSLHTLKLSMQAKGFACNSCCAMQLELASLHTLELSMQGFACYSCCAMQLELASFHALKLSAQDFACNLREVRLIQAFLLPPPYKASVPRSCKIKGKKKKKNSRCAVQLGLASLSTLKPFSYRPRGRPAIMLHHTAF